MNMVAQNCYSDGEKNPTIYKLHALYNFIAGYYDRHVIAALLFVESLTNIHVYIYVHVCMHTHAHMHPACMPGMGQLT